LGGNHMKNPWPTISYPRLSPLRHHLFPSSSLPIVTRSVFATSLAPALGFAAHRDSSSSRSRKCLGEFCSGFQLFRSSSNGRARAVAVASQQQPKLVSTNLDLGPIMLLVENVLLPLDALRGCSSCASAPCSRFVAATVL
jgi:hypothetical protein